MLKRQLSTSAVGPAVAMRMMWLLGFGRPNASEETSLHPTSSYPAASRTSTSTFRNGGFHRCCMAGLRCSCNILVLGLMDRYREVGSTGHSRNDAAQRDARHAHDIQGKRHR